LGSALTLDGELERHLLVAGHRLALQVVELVGAQLAAGISRALLVDLGVNPPRASQQDGGGGAQEEEEDGGFVRPEIAAVAYALDELALLAAAILGNHRATKLGCGDFLGLGSLGNLGGAAALASSLGGPNGGQGGGPRGPQGGSAAFAVAAAAWDESLSPWTTAAAENDGDFDENDDGDDAGSVGEGDQEQDEAAGASAEARGGKQARAQAKAIESPWLTRGLGLFLAQGPGNAGAAPARGRRGPSTTLQRALGFDGTALHRSAVKEAVRRQGGSAAGGERGGAVGGRKGAGVQLDIERVFAEKVVFLSEGDAALHVPTITLAVMKLALKALTEVVRRLTIRHAEAFQQLQVEVQYLRSVAAYFLGDSELSSVADSMLDEVMVSAAERCASEPQSFALGAADLANRTADALAKLRLASARRGVNE